MEYSCIISFYIFLGVCVVASSQEISKSNKLNFFILIAGIVAPTAYLMGITFHQGNLSAYGVSSELFAISVQDAYINAYYSVAFYLMVLTSLIVKVLNFLFSAPNLYISVFAIFGISLFIYILIKLFKKLSSYNSNNKFIRLKRLLSFLHWRRNDFTKAVGVTGLASYSFVLILYILMVLSVFWLVLPIMAYYKSFELAEKKRDNFLQKGCYIKEGEFWGNCKTLKNKSGEVIYKGLLIAQTEKHIAFFTKKGAFIITYPTDSVVENSFELK